jgi:hypothetical protein
VEKLPTAGQFLLSPGGQFFISPSSPFAVGSTAEGGDARAGGGISALLRLNELGFGTRRLRARLGPSQTVKSYVEAGAWRTYKQPARWEERAGWGRGLSAIAATGTSFARS